MNITEREAEVIAEALTVALFVWEDTPELRAKKQLQIQDARWMLANVFKNARRLA